MTIDETARFMGVSRRTVYLWIEQGDLEPYTVPYGRVSTRYRVRKAEARRHLKEYQKPGAMRQPVVGRLLAYGENGFYEFSTGKVRGLVKVLGERIEILALHANEQGKGHFSAFLEELRGAYTEIIVWEVMNKRLERMLRRQGFVGLTAIDGETNDVHTGLAWRR